MLLPCTRFVTLYPSTPLYSIVSNQLLLGTIQISICTYNPHQCLPHFTFVFLCYSFHAILHYLSSSLVVSSHEAFRVHADRGDRILTLIENFNDHYPIGDYQNEYQGHCFHQSLASIVIKTSYLY